MSFVSQLFVAAFLSTALAATYPPTYPFENESMVPVGVAPAAPSFAFDDSDPGGYVYTFGFTGVVPDDGSDWCFGANGLIMHLLKVRQGAPPVLPTTVWNCTARHTISAATYLDTIADIKVCDGKCCEESYGFPTFFQAEFQEADYTRDSENHVNGLCEEMYSEEIFCGWADNGFRHACYEYILSGSERPIIHPCYDGLYNYYLQCKLFKASGYTENNKADPEAYLDSLTAEEKNAWSTVFRSTDKVCHPYSYYYPEFAKTGSESAETKSDESEPSTSQSSPSTLLTITCTGLVGLL